MRDFITSKLSDCCGARVILGDFCSDCREHCDCQTLEAEDGNVETVSNGDGREICERVVRAQEQGAAGGKRFAQVARVDKGA